MFAVTSQCIFGSDFLKLSNETKKNNIGETSESEATAEGEEEFDTLDVGVTVKKLSNVESPWVNELIDVRDDRSSKALGNAVAV